MSWLRFWLPAGFVSLGFVMASVSCAEDPPIDLPTEGGAGGTGGGGGAGPTEGVISASSASVNETDPQITVKGANVVVVWTGRQSNGTSHIGYTISNNGGATFSTPAQIQPPDGLRFDAPDVVIDSGDNVHIAFVGFSRTGEGADLYRVTFPVTGSAGMAENISDPDDMAIGFYSRPRMGFTNGGRLMVVHTETVDQNAVLAVLSKLPTEDVWTRSQLSQNNNYSFPYPCSANLTMMGQSYIVAVQGGRLLLFRSDDDGMNWNAIEAQDAGEGGQVRGPVTCVADEQNVWMTYGLAGSDGLSKIRAAVSQDGGQSVALWGTISDPDIKPKFALNATALQKPETVHVVYYNGAGAGDLVGSLLRVRYTPANLMDQMPPMMPGDPEPGLPGILVAEPIVFQNDEDDARWLGTGVGLRYQDNALYVAYVDNAANAAHISFKVIDQ